MAADGDLQSHLAEAFPREEEGPEAYRAVLVVDSLEVEVRTRQEGEDLGREGMDGLLGGRVVVPGIHQEGVGGYLLGEEEVRCGLQGHYPTTRPELVGRKGQARSFLQP